VASDVFILNIALAAFAAITIWMTSTAVQA
jgi:hypothetical protein